MRNDPDPDENEARTSIQVYQSDRERLQALFGEPAAEAFRRALADVCRHPEPSKVWTSGVVADRLLAKSLRAAGEQIEVVGFYCTACEQFIFRRQGVAVAAR